MDGADAGHGRVLRACAVAGGGAGPPAQRGAGHFCGSGGTHPARPGPPVLPDPGRTADRAAAPLASDTPMEVLARAFEHGALRDASARELVAMFEEARFSPHSMLEWQRMRAEQLLRVVLADLQGEMA